jgi:hypothetical protein
MIMTQPLKTINAARGKMTQKAICGKDADMGGLLCPVVFTGSCLRPRQITLTGQRGKTVNVHCWKGSSARDHHPI